MISSRGPNDILVVDRSCVPVMEVCSAVIDARTPSEIMAKYQVNEQELFACIDVFSSVGGLTKDDFLELSSIEETDDNGDADIDIETTAVSDGVFLTLVSHGKQEVPSESEFRLLFVYGLRGILMDCLHDIAVRCADYELSDIHDLVYDSFARAYGEVSPEDALSILEELKDGLTEI